MARRTAKKLPSIIQLTPLEQCELRILDVMRCAAQADLQAKDAFLKNRAHQIAGAHGVDLSKEADGSWDLRIDEGMIRKVKD